jgi:cytosine/adenosine deaminase-related metal-dependent hydrolase
VPEPLVIADEDAAAAARRAIETAVATGGRTAVWVGPAEGAAFAEFAAEIGLRTREDR